MPPAESKNPCGRRLVKKLLLFLLGGGKGFLGGLRLGGALLEFVHASGGVHELLLAGVERVAHVANADDNQWLGGAGLDLVAAGATDFRVHIFRMNVRLHKKGPKCIMDALDDKGEFAVIAHHQPKRSLPQHMDGSSEGIPSHLWNVHTGKNCCEYCYE